MMAQSASLLLALVIPSLLSVAGPGTAQEGGCNPCECNVAIGCANGGPLVVLVDEWQVPETVPSDSNFTIRFHAILLPFLSSGSADGRNETVRLTITAGSERRADSDVEANLPGWVNATVHAGAPGRISLEVSSPFASGKVASIVVEKPLAIPGPGPFALVAMLALAVISRRPFA